MLQDPWRSHVLTRTGLHRKKHSHFSYNLHTKKLKREVILSESGDNCTAKPGFSTSQPTAATSSAANNPKVPTIDKATWKKLHFPFTSYQGIEVFV